MAAKAWIENALREQHIPFEEVKHDPAYTAQELAQQELPSLLWSSPMGTLTG
jgi:hypothetical protein